MNKIGGGQRDSSIELLRIFCIIGIVSMHVFGFNSFYNAATGINLVYGVFINSLFNACVSIFVLISGYFGVKTSINKMLHLWIRVVVFSLLGVAVSNILGNVNGTMELLKELWKAIFPISSVKYWYITAYFLLIFFADYINRIPERLDRKQFERLILLLLIVFSILPTFTFMHVMNDGGKGFANMFLMYLIGRYIRTYDVVLTFKGRNINLISCKMSKLALIALFVLLVEFCMNMIVSSFGNGVGVSALFARDCSIFIVSLAILIFLLFSRIHFSSSFVNKIASHVLGVYLIERTVRTILGRFFDINVFADCWYLFAVIFVYAIVVIAISMMIDWIYKMTIGKLADVAIDKISVRIGRRIES